MRKKLISNTYLRDISAYTLRMEINDKDYYLAVKHIIKTEKPFILSTGLCLINNGYYIVELLPKEENYSLRVYLNEKKEILEYYFDVSLENGLDMDTKVPFYDDLYIDITVTNGAIEVLDEDELDMALNNKTISMEQYNLACNVKNKLLNELNNGTNKYMNINLKEFL